MKILTKEEEAEHYRATLFGGTIAGVAGLAVGVAGVGVASRRYHFIKNLTLPLKAFLVTSSGSFAGIIGADHASRSYESARNPIDVEYREREARQAQADRASKTFTQRAMDFGKKERYKIVGASWVASMGIAFSLVNRNKYLSGPQKLVQARVYAQFLTLGVLVASAAFEISDSKKKEGRWETVQYVDPKDPEHKRMLQKQEYREGEGGEHHDGKGTGANDDLWKEMVAAEEERLKEREEEEKKFRHKKSEGGKGKKETKKGGEEGKEKEEKKSEKEGEDKEDKEKDEKSKKSKK